MMYLTELQVNDPEMEKSGVWMWHDHKAVTFTQQWSGETRHITSLTLKTVSQGEVEQVKIETVKSLKGGI